MQFFNFILSFAIVKILLICIILDTIFGVLRSIREHKLNSNIGIDGTIRKAGMIIAILFFYLIDYVGNINVVGFIPENALNMIEVKQIGIGVLFNILFIVYEIISILKNMVKCKLPIPKKLQSFLEKILKEFTTELKENDENDKGN